MAGRSESKLKQVRDELVKINPDCEVCEMEEGWKKGDELLDRKRMEDSYTDQYQKTVTGVSKQAPYYDRKEMSH